MGPHGVMAPRLLLGAWAARLIGHKSPHPRPCRDALCCWSSGGEASSSSRIVGPRRLVGAHGDCVAEETCRNAGLASEPPSWTPHPTAMLTLILRVQRRARYSDAATFPMRRCRAHGGERQHMSFAPEGALHKCACNPFRSRRMARSRSTGWKRVRRFLHKSLALADAQRWWQPSALCHIQWCFLQC